ncbi:hypothetical protein KsCSTR_09270 [Candidatus Kuenenia stuttgartiensis]|jgi:hypothetical protein|uniref:Thymidylate kinase n=1 Tax=Kuenenia stuttgartiensis TaxID=174633 RepID=Q1PZ24_KUEST|nr:MULTISPECIES: hypothetical protein [Kuenenia]MBE7547406.1 hypothetical protein [Planctomycetia bacterium]MBW7942596.1 hypothetical protein [Candidatus Kuenenia stuttgartiensis]MBZ0191381.1 hypothetical protein [Candidatus Kuenenia stuttgartiensis]MCL4728635.1 hypothetical protein [Candidatus Kuenenia stuttgartiensis]MCZ7623781.1 hypothetical protein [Candidatus Kuenenia sp.]
MEKHVTTEEKRLYQKEIKKYITFFRKSYERAHLQIDISGLSVKQAAARIKEALEMFDNKVR